MRFAETEGLPARGSFLSNRYPVRKKFFHLTTACALVLLALGVMSPYFKYIPKSTLSAVIISAVIFMVEVHMVPDLWRIKKVELLIMLITFFSCLFLGAEYGILVGVTVSLLILLYKSARPQITVKRTAHANVEYILIQPEQSLFFPALEYLRYHVRKAMHWEANSAIPIVVDGSHISSTDFTVTQGIKQMLEDFHRRNHKIIFINFGDDVLKLLYQMGVEYFIHINSIDDLDIIKNDDKPHDMASSNSGPLYPAPSPLLKEPEPRNEGVVTTFPPLERYDRDVESQRW